MRRGAACALLMLLPLAAADLPAGERPDAPRPFIRLTHDGYFKQRPSWSPDGKQLAFARHRGATIFVYVRDADGMERRLTDRDAPEYDAVWSPDGARLALAVDKTTPNQGDLEVYTIGADGEDLQPLAVTSGKLSHEESPSWSPDGRWMAYTSTRDGNQELYVARPNGKDARRLTNHAAIDAHPSWSADGKRIAFATNRWGDLELAVVDVEDATVTRLTESRGMDEYPAFSPDGKRLAFASNRDGNLEIYVAEADGSSPRNVSRHEGIDNFPAWTPDGRLTFVSNREGGFEVYVEAAGRP